MSVRKVHRFLPAAKPSKSYRAPIFFFYLSISESSKEGQTRQIKHPKTSIKGKWTMGKLMMRSDLASEAIWRPEQPQRICLKKSRCCNFLTTNQISTRCSLSSNNELKLVPWSHRTWKSTPPMAAAGLLGPELVSQFFWGNTTFSIYLISYIIAPFTSIRSKFKCEVNFMPFSVVSENLLFLLHMSPLVLITPIALPLPLMCFCK